MSNSSRVKILGLAAAAALTVGALTATPASAAAVNQWAYHNGYSDHTWSNGGYMDGYVGSYGAYNDSPTWQRGYAYPPSYYPSGYAYGYPYDEGYYPYGYAPAPGVGVQVGPVGVDLW